MVDTPFGVPVKIRSPDLGGTSSAILDKISVGDQIILLQKEFCLTSPFTSSFNSISEKSIILLIGIISEIGALPTKFFPTNHGLAACFASVWRSLLVRSTPTAIPNIFASLPSAKTNSTSC